MHQAIRDRIGDNVGRACHSQPTFNKRMVDREIAPQGSAMTDDHFSGGGDKIRYEVAIGNAQGLQVEAELLFQPISY
jgi:hypothetical protein